jgi:hypothetical protein
MTKMTVLACVFILAFCLADEGSNSLRFALIEKKEPQILRMSRIKTNKNP